ncbi:hypothetical protein ACFFMN_00185 [Planobispora siamensis]|uniref:Alpha/beta hydrolase n=1 Tax=Planobispora siamensis TaxID=936338 RepID=A0A8J3SHS4_9ACTN|nr:hypothetical protein [Planobispora siamensis]GIH93225.1 hypothetical protein Psi01_38550 [Planobispora siamensis]
MTAQFAQPGAEGLALPGEPVRLIEGADHLWTGLEDGEPLFREALEFARRLLQQVPAGTA